MLFVRRKFTIINDVNRLDFSQNWEKVAEGRMRA